MKTLKEKIESIPYLPELKKQLLLRALDYQKTDTSNKLLESLVNQHFEICNSLPEYQSSPNLRIYVHLTSNGGIDENPGYNLLLTDLDQTTKIGHGYISYKSFPKKEDFNYVAIDLNELFIRYPESTTTDEFKPVLWKYYNF